MYTNPTLMYELAKPGRETAASDNAARAGPASALPARAHGVAGRRRGCPFEGDGQPR